MKHDERQMENSKNESSNSLQKLKMAVVDDSVDDAARISCLLRKCCSEAYEIRCFSDCNELLSGDDHFELIVLDIHLDKEDGIEMQKKLQNHTSYIVFFTAYPTKIRFAFGYKVIGFINKNDPEQEIIKQLDQIKRDYLDDFVTLFSNNGIVQIRRNQISRVSVENRKIYVYLADERVLRITNGSLGKCVETIGDILQRINPSEYINLDHIRRIEGQKITLINGVIVYASRRMRNEVQEKYVRRLR